VSLIEVQVEVQAPPERVWEVVSDPRNLPTWDRRITAVRGVPPGGLREGSRYTTEVRFMGARITVESEVLELRPPEYAKVRVSGPMDAIVETWVEPAGPGTALLRHRVDYRLRGGPLGELVAGAIRMLGAQSMLKRGATAQKRQAESKAG
jgi:carbon monoxide dehydrogenase subunit G